MNTAYVLFALGVVAITVSIWLAWGGLARLGVLAYLRPGRTSTRLHLIAVTDGLVAVAYGSLLESRLITNNPKVLISSFLVVCLGIATVIAGDKWVKWGRSWQASMGFPVGPSCLLRVLQLYAAFVGLCFVAVGIYFVVPSR